MSVLADQLRIPDWFGWNWDALQDSLRDLSWLSEDTVVVHHERVPDLPVDELRTYLAILDEVAHGNRATGSPAWR
jgi:hypothetical protein